MIIIECKKTTYESAQQGMRKNQEISCEKL